MLTRSIRLEPASPAPSDSPTKAHRAMTPPTIATRRIRTGLELTELGLGAAQFGNLFRETTDEESERAVSVALEEGIRYLDTAPHYGLGLSEQRLGRALAAIDRD